MTHHLLNRPFVNSHQFWFWLTTLSPAKTQGRVSFFKQLISSLPLALLKEIFVIHIPQIFTMHTK